MLKFHHITAFMKMHANFQKIFLIRVFWFEYMFPIKYKIHILNLMLLPKNSVPFEGLLTTVMFHICKVGLCFYRFANGYFETLLFYPIL